MKEMDDVLKVGKFLVSLYASSSCDEKAFARVAHISNDTSGAADYLALLAYPSPKDDSRRIHFRNALLSAFVRDEIKNSNDKSKVDVDSLMVSFELDKLMIWRDIDRAITGGVKKRTGGGVKKLIDRFQAYHAFCAYDRALSDGASLTWETVLSRISKAYESERSRLQDPDDRIDNLKKIFRASRPVLHLVFGYIRSISSKGWTNEKGQIPHLISSIYDPSWLKDALDISEVVLGMQLIEHESKLKIGKKLRGHTFEPSEITHICPF